MLILLYSNLQLVYCCLVNRLSLHAPPTLFSAFVFDVMLLKCYMRYLKCGSWGNKPGFLGSPFS